MEPEHRNVTLTDREIEAMEAEIAREIARLGPPPTVEELRRRGYTEYGKLNMVLDIINGFGRVVNLLIAEIIQSIAAVALAVIFGIVEYWRVHNGTLALGQTETQSSQIAFAVVVANVIFPIWVLRQIRGQSILTVTRHTFRGYIGSFIHRLSGVPTDEIVDVYYNPRLNLASSILTWGTIFLAIYDLLGPLLTSVFTGKETEPIPILVIKLVIGLLLSVAGVFYLQSASHAIGARTLTDNPNRLIDIVEAQRAEYQQRANEIRIDVKAKHEAAKADRLEARLSALEDSTANPRLPAVSKTTKDSGQRRNRNAKQDFADWFNSQPPEIQEAILSGQIGLREAGRRAGVSKDIANAHLKALKTPRPSTNGHREPKE